VIAIGAVAAAVMSASAAGGGGVTGHSNRPTTGASITHGRPTAVVVLDGSGSVVGRWSSSGGGQAPQGWTCRYFAVEGDGGAGFEMAIADAPAAVLEPGGWYGLLCRDDLGVLVYQQLVQWDAADPLAGVAVEERLAEQAVASLELPAPKLAGSPPLDADQLVGLPMWLWLEDWPVVTATAGLAGVTATVTAHPVSARWDLGDGGSVVCDGPGLPWTPTPGADGSGIPCTSTWTSSSHDVPGGRAVVTATVTWQVDWLSSTGVAGSLGVLETTAGTTVRVVEAQAVIEY
jgi:hypothetical protein